MPRTGLLSVILCSFAIASCAKNETFWPSWGAGKAEVDEEWSDDQSACAVDRSACTPVALGSNLLTNSEFEEGVEGWTIQTTGENGSLGRSTLSRVAQNDIRGDGGMTQAIQLQVGQITYVGGKRDENGGYVPGPAEGAILSQEIDVVGSGLLEVTVDVAVYMREHVKWQNNKHAGKFVLVVDEQEYVTVDFGEIKRGETMRRTLTARLEITEGKHLVALKIVRPMEAEDKDVMPTQYVDNFRAALVVEGPPEPQQPYKEEPAPAEPLPVDDEVQGQTPTEDTEVIPPPEETETVPEGTEQKPEGTDGTGDGTEEDGVSDEEANLPIWVNLDVVQQKLEALS